MNFITALIDSIVDFVRRNPLTCIFLVMLAVFVPSAFGALVIGVLIVGLLILALPIIGLLRLRRISRDFEQQARQQQQQFRGQQGFGGQGYGQDYGQDRANREGEVKVYSNGEAQTKRVSDDVGDYVEFEEVKVKVKDNNK